jgi:hypothetical protein
MVGRTRSLDRLNYDVMGLNRGIVADSILPRKVSFICEIEKEDEDIPTRPAVHEEERDIGSQGIRVSHIVPTV